MAYSSKFFSYDGISGIGNASTESTLPPRSNCSVFSENSIRMYYKASWCIPSFEGVTVTAGCWNSCQLSILVSFSSFGCDAALSRIKGNSIIDFSIFYFKLITVNKIIVVITVPCSIFINALSVYVIRIDSRIAKRLISIPASESF